MLKKYFPVLMMLFIVLTITFGSSIAVYAADDPTDWMKSQSGTSAVQATTNQIKTLGVSIHTLIQTVLNILGLLSFMIYGGKWWMAGNDSSKKKELKEEGSNWLKGSVFLFGASFIYKLIYTLVTSFSNTTTTTTPAK